MVFSAFSMVSSFEADNTTDDSAGVGQEKNPALLYHIDTVRSRMKAEQGKSFSTAA